VNLSCPPGEYVHVTLPPAPYAAFFVPLARSVELSVGENFAALRGALQLALATRLEQLCAPLLTLEYALFCHARSGGLLPFDPRQAVDEDYLHQLSAGDWEELLARRPMLRRVVNLAVEQWRAAAQELSERLALDAAALRLTFGITGQPTEILLGISDMHHAGRSAAILTFSGGQRLVYKPKDSSVDWAWHRFGQWLKQHDAPWYPTEQKQLARQGYGWVDFVSTLPCDSVAQQHSFFNRLGQLQALLYLLGATDCHRENFIVHGTEPVLIDLETLLHPQPPNDPMPSALRQSVLSVEILPCRYIGAGQQEIYFPGFDQEWHQDAHLSSNSFSLRAHAEPFGSGFATMYHFLLRHQQCLSDLNNGPLAEFRACTVRYVHRPTTTYALTLRRALRHLDERLEGGMSFEVMQRFNLPGLSEQTAERLHGAEHAAMRQLDIPLFSARSDGTALHWQGGGPIEHFFTEPALEQARHRVLNWSEDDLTRQLEAIDQALSH
jgi:lantibiotic modifying enzyme